MWVVCEEIFGFVVMVIWVKDYDEVLEIVNDMLFGLLFGICIMSLKYVLYFKCNVEVGMVMVNLLIVGVDYYVLFGGWKGLFYGLCEQGCYVVEFYIMVKIVYIFDGNLFYVLKIMVSE